MAIPAMAPFDRARFYSIVVPGQRASLTITTAGRSGNLDLFERVHGVSGAFTSTRW